MSNHKIDPNKVTKPIQLLAAWLVGLVVVDGSFLTAARLITNPDWISAALVIAAILNVPIFVTAIFLLQTRFRPEMQEDTYYSQYLREQRSIDAPENLSKAVSSLRTDVFEANTNTLEIIKGVQSQVKELTAEVSVVATHAGIGESVIPRIDRLEEAFTRSGETIDMAKRGAEWEKYTVGINDLLPDYKVIIRTLAEKQILVSRTFGAFNDREIPAIRDISFSDDVDIRNIQEIIQLLQRFEFDAISILNSETLAGRITIGSYAYEISSPAKIDQALLTEILREDMTMDELVNVLFKKRSQVFAEFVDKEVAARFAEFVRV